MVMSDDGGGSKRAKDAVWSAATYSSGEGRRAYMLSRREMAQRRIGASFCGASLFHRTLSRRGETGRVSGM